MDILESLKFASVSSSIVFLLFETEVIAEYAKLLGLRKIFALDRYKCYKIKSPYGNYFSFLRERKDCFLTRLISCSYCLGFWICAVSGLYECNIFLTYTLYLIILKIITPKNE